MVRVTPLFYSSRQKILSFPNDMMLAVDLSHMDFSTLRSSPSLANLFWATNTKECCTWTFCSYWEDHKIFLICSFMIRTVFIDLCICKQPCIPGIKPTWAWWMVFLMPCWIRFTSVLYEDFCIYVHMIYSSALCMCRSFVFVCFLYQLCWSYKICLEGFSLFQFFGML